MEVSSPNCCSKHGHSIRYLKSWSSLVSKISKAGYTTAPLGHPSSAPFSREGFLHTLAYLNLSCMTHAAAQATQDVSESPCTALHPHSVGKDMGAVRGDESMFQAAPHNVFTSILEREGCSLLLHPSLTHAVLVRLSPACKDCQP